MDDHSIDLFNQNKIFELYLYVHFEISFCIIGMWANSQVYMQLDVNVLAMSMQN